MSDDIPVDLPQGRETADLWFEDLPTRRDSTLSMSLEFKRNYLADMLAALKDQDVCGLLLKGRPGIGKSFLVRQLLGGDQNYIPVTGHISRIEAIEKLEQQPNRLFVFDDVSGCTNDQSFHQLLLHALGAGDPVTGARIIEYNVRGNRKRFAFTGAVLFVGNSAFRGASPAVIEALESRVETVEYAPSREEVEWQLYQMAESGLKGLAPNESIRLTTYVLRKCRAAQRIPDIRLLLDSILPMYRRWHRGLTQCSWEEHVSRLVREPSTPTKRHWTAAERRTLLLELQRKFAITSQRIEEYFRETGLSRATYFRDVEELLPPGTEIVAADSEPEDSSR